MLAVDDMFPEFQLAMVAAGSVGRNPEDLLRVPDALRIHEPAGE